MVRPFVVLLLASLTWSAALAQPPAKPRDDSLAVPPLEDLLGASLTRRDPFTAGQCDLQFLVGYFKKTSWGPGGPPLDYAPIAFRSGIILNDPIDWMGPFRGSIESLLEVNYSPILGDFGSYITGPNWILRYNFVQPQCAVVPYLQAGAGFGFNDAFKDLNQHLIGGRFEFLLRGEAGARVMLTESFSLDAEVGFQHISNATIYTRNGGINNVGFALGLTYFFGKAD